MRLMNGITGKLFLGLLLLVMVSVISPQQASAFSLDVENSFSQTLYLTAVDFDENYNQWRVHGWWSVTPNSIRTLEFPNSTSKKYVYVFGYAGNIIFDGQGTVGALNYTIINDKFEYYLPDGVCPPGRNRRTVTFMRLNIEEGYAYWSPAAG
mgnify:FL=1